ncbi:MAG: hypothetical protein JWP74_1763 [Marmoricola sp.]|nr:hypothetical protein [Marmoricola sp.]
MPEYIRVTDEVKPYREYSVVASAVDPNVHKVLDKPGAYSDGQPIEPKYTPEALSGKADATPAPAPNGQKADPSKENS